MPSCSRRRLSTLVLLTSCINGLGRERLLASCISGLDAERLLAIRKRYVGPGCVKKTKLGGVNEHRGNLGGEESGKTIGCAFCDSSHYKR